MGPWAGFPHPCHARRNDEKTWRLALRAAWGRAPTMERDWWHNALSLSCATVVLALVGAWAGFPHPCPHEGKTRNSRPDVEGGVGPSGLAAHRVVALLRYGGPAPRGDMRVVLPPMPPRGKAKKI